MVELIVVFLCGLILGVLVTTTIHREGAPYQRFVSTKPIGGWNMKDKKYVDIFHTIRKDVTSATVQVVIFSDKGIPYPCMEGSCVDVEVQYFPHHIRLIAKNGLVTADFKNSVVNRGCVTITEEVNKDV